MNTDNFSAYDKQVHEQFCTPAKLERDLEILKGILEGIVCDKIINEREFIALNKWTDDVRKYASKKPYENLIITIESALSDKILTEEERDNIFWLCENFIEQNNYYNLITSGVQELTGIVRGITCDDEINKEELDFLDAWMEKHEYLKNCWPYDELYSLTLDILQDQIVTEDEQKKFLAFCQCIVGTNEETSTESLINILKTGFCQVDPQIKVPEHSFCITGISKKHSRKEIAERIELYGGFVTDQVNKKLNYLIVCDEKNNCWTYTCYGRKIEQAVKLRREGIPVAIIHEFDLYDVLESMA